MSPRARTILFHAIVVTTLLAAAAGETYSRGAIDARTGRDGQTTDDALPVFHPEVACAFTVVPQCRGLEWWPH